MHTIPDVNQLKEEFRNVRAAERTQNEMLTSLLCKDSDEYGPKFSELQIKIFVSFWL